MIKLLLCLFFFVSLSADEIEQMLRSHMQEHGIPGLAAVIVREGKSTIYTLGWSDRERRKPIEESTIFNLASVTKVFLTTSLAVEVIEGRMQLNEPVITYFPELQQGPMKGFARVRLVDLASHTASLPRDPPFKPVHGKYTRHEVFHFLRNWHPAYPVSSKYEYSNLSFGILGLTLEEVGEKPLQAVFRETIFAPLGMRETELEVPRRLQAERAIGYTKKGVRAKHFQPNLWPDGGSLNSSALDMQKFLLANMGLLGPPKLLEAMQLAQKSVFKTNDRLSLGLAWQTFQNEGLTIIDKDGGVGAYSSYIGFTQDKKTGVVLLSNKGGAKLPPFGRQLLRSIHQGEGTPDN